jgi:hypothetical protein
MAPTPGLLTIRWRRTDSGRPAGHAGQERDQRRHHSREAEQHERALAPSPENIPSARTNNSD